MTTTKTTPPQLLTHATDDGHAAYEQIGRALALDFRETAKQWSGADDTSDQTYMVEWRFLNDQGETLHTQAVHVATVAFDGTSDTGLISVMNRERAMHHFTGGPDAQRVTNDWDYSKIDGGIGSLLAAIADAKAQ